MKKLAIPRAISSSVALTLLLVGCQSVDIAEAPSEYRLAPTETEVVPTGAAHGVLVDNGFTQFASVFGIPVVGTDRVSRTGMDNAVSILQMYLDNDENGVADNPAVVFALREVNAVSAVFSTFSEHEDFEDRNGYFSTRSYNVVTMMEEEMYLENSGFDAALEETLHLVTQWGFAMAYPEIFGEKSGTDLANSLDQAMAEGYFRYDDPTCGYSCLNTEFFYWAITSYMGLQESRCDEISREWELCTRQSLRDSGLSVVTFIEDPQYGIPTDASEGRS
jgi:hypothetical protein